MKALCLIRRPHSNEGVVSAKAPARLALVQEGSTKAPAMRDEGVVSAKASAMRDEGVVSTKALVKLALVQDGSAGSTQLRCCVWQSFG